MAKQSALAKAQQALCALADELGLEFVDAQLKKEPEGMFLRVFVDKEGGLGLDACEAYHRRCIPLLEEVEYDYLECSSPGIDRPLKRERDYQKHLGEQIEVRLFSKKEGQKVFCGVLQQYENGAIVLGCPDGGKRFELKEIALARPVIDYDAQLS